MQINEKEQATEIVRRSGTDISKCMQCGKCTAACPAGYKMDIQPHRVVWELINEHVDILQKAVTPWKCLSCFACAERCPRGVSPAALIESVRLSIIRQQGENCIAVEEIPAYIDEKMPQQAIVAAFRKYNK
jgi:heterodisulfide reductase subunit C2